MKKINKYKLLASICAMALLVSCDYENINTDRQGMTDEEGIRDGFAVGGSVTSMQKQFFQWGHKLMIRILSISIRLLITFQEIVGVAFSDKIMIGEVIRTRLIICWML